jgi:hypothetical protein
MDIKNLKLDIKSRLKNNPKEALYGLDLALDPSSDLYDDFISIQSRYNELLRNRAKGLISNEEYQLGYSKICDSILYLTKEIGADDIKHPNSNKKDSRDSDDNRLNYEVIEYGVVKIKENRYRISVSSTVFFSNRFSSAFPGVRGIKEFKEASIGLYRLGLLLKEPVYFDEINGHNVVNQPIWWYRGRKNMYIDEFEVVSNEMAILGTIEIYKPKVIVYCSGSYYRSFVYVRISGNEPVGIYGRSKTDIQNMVDNFGYSMEEYGIFNGELITREEFDDGAAVIEGKVYDTIALASLRRRYLTDYNIIICSKFHPFNDVKIGTKFNDIMDRLLIDKEKEFEELVSFAEDLPRHYLDD